MSSAPELHRANAPHYEFPESEGRALVGEKDVAAELEAMRQIVHDLRNPVGSVSMAIEMLLGPLRSALSSLEPEMRRRVEGTLVALQESARQLRYLVSQREAKEGVAPRVVPPTKPTVSQAEFVTDGAANAGTEIPAAPTPRSPRKSDSKVDLDDIFRRLEILTVTRSSLPALLAVDTCSGLSLKANGPELLRALSNLIENGIEASAAADPGTGPWTVQVRAFPEEEELLIEIENQGEGISREILDWLKGSPDLPSPSSTKNDEGLHGVGLRVARRVAEEHGGRLEGESKKGTTVMRMRFPL